MLLRRMYGWYYGRFSLIALPALAMFWTGVGYRVQQYGFTQDRVYLAVCGAIMTVTILLFSAVGAGRYLYVAALSGVLLAVFTYIPGVTAAAIGIRSQMQRAERIVVRLGLADASGRLILQKRPDADSVYREVTVVFTNRSNTSPGTVPPDLWRNVTRWTTRSLCRTR